MDTLLPCEILSFAFVYGVAAVKTVIRNGCSSLYTGDLALWLLTMATILRIYCIILG